MLSVRWRDSCKEIGSNLENSYYKMMIMELKFLRAFTNGRPSIYTVGLFASVLLDLYFAILISTREIIAPRKEQNYGKNLFYNCRHKTSLWIGIF